MKEELGFFKKLRNNLTKRDNKSGLKERPGIIIKVPSNQEVLLGIIPLYESSVKKFTKLPSETQDIILSDLKNKKEIGMTPEDIEARFNYFLENIENMNNITDSDINHHPKPSIEQQKFNLEMGSVFKDVDENVTDQIENQEMAIELEKRKKIEQKPQ